MGKNTRSVKNIQILMFLTLYAGIRGYVLNAVRRLRKQAKDSPFYPDYLR